MSTRAKRIEAMIEDGWGAGFLRIQALVSQFVEREVADLEAERDAARARVAELERELAATMVWADVEDTPEAAEIRAAFPTRSGDHAHYAQAQALVSARHSKGALVAMTNWLLRRAGLAERRVIGLRAQVAAMGSALEAFRSAGRAALGALSTGDGAHAADAEMRAAMERSGRALDGLAADNEVKR